MPPNVAITPKNYTAQKKIELLEQMGFVAVWDDHQPDCPHSYYDAEDEEGGEHGLLCNCIPPGTSWHAPKDVAEHIGEWPHANRNRRSANR